MPKEIKHLKAVKEDEVDLKEVSELARKGASTEDIGRILGYNSNLWRMKRITNSDIDEAIHQGAATLKVSILNYQFDKARKGDTRMLIWLGKQHLGQTEKAGEQKEALSFEREKETVKEAIRKDPRLIEKIFNSGEK